MVERDNSGADDDSAAGTTGVETSQGEPATTEGSGESAGSSESGGSSGESTGGEESSGGDATTGVATPEPDPDACETLEAQQGCALEDGGEGVQFCALIGEVQKWGTCVTEVACELGDYVECDPFNGSYYSEQCMLDAMGVPAWTEVGEECFTPLVLRFDAAPVELALADGHGFDISGRGACFSSDWPTAATPWLALDRDENGSIDDARELFGSGVTLKDGRGAHDGFVALAEHDADGDGRISAEDPVWPALVLWSDHDADRRSTAWELEPLAARGVTEIRLDVRVDRRCDERGNCEAERSGFNYMGRDGRSVAGEVIDLHLMCQ